MMRALSAETHSTISSHVSLPNLLFCSLFQAPCSQCFILLIFVTQHPPFIPAHL